MPGHNGVAPVGSDHEDPLLADIGKEEGQKVHRRAVRPLEVFDDQDDRRLLAESTQEAEHGLEEPQLGRPGHSFEARPLPAWLLQIREKPRQLGMKGIDHGAYRGCAAVANQTSDGFDEWPVGQAVLATLHAATGDNGGTLAAGMVQELVDEPRLADPTLATDHHGRRPAAGRGVERGCQPLQLVATADEARAPRFAHHGDYFSRERHREGCYHHGLSR